MHTLNRFLGLKRVPSALTGAALVALVPSSAMAMDPFVDSSELMQTEASNSGAPMAVADMNGDGLDDIVHLHRTRYLQIEYQQDDGSFVLGDEYDTMQGAWGMSVADVDGNGFNDIFIGDAFNRKDLYLANEDGTGYTAQDIGGPGIFVQCSSFSDINNDGSLDFFVCADTSKSLVYHGDSTGALSPTYEALDPVSTVSTAALPDANSGNYGNVWSDFDLDGDPDLYISKCRQGIADPDDGRRLNSLFQNNGDGTYSEVSESVGLLPRGQTWASDFADIDNDGDMDAFILNHEDFPGDAPSDLFENDGGSYTAISEAAGIRDALDGVGTGIQTVFADFDNDGWIDLLISSGGSGDHQILFNNGDGTFTPDSSVLPTGNRTMQSFAIGDLNNDGSVDIMAGFGAGFNQFTGSPDLLFLNPATDGNNWIKVNLTGVESNRSAIGAVIQITGSWGTQTREIRAGESYGISHSLTEHFGLGADETVETMTITWPSGTVDVIEDIEGNQTVNISEGCQTEYFTDADGDGFGDPDSGQASCFAPKDSVEDGTDCDDDNENNYPGNAEVCDGEDNNCDGTADEGLEDCDAGSSSGGEDTDGDSDSDSDSDSDGPTTDSDSTTGPVDPTSDSDSDTEGDTDDSAGAGGGGGGCAVATPTTDAAFLLMLLGLGAPLARRRKRC